MGIEELHAKSWSRRQFLRGSVVTGLAVAGGVSGCGDSTDVAATKKEPRPGYYPSSYDAVVEASKKDHELTIYSNMDSYNWQPIMDGYQKHYPWVEKISTNNLDSSEVFERYYAESSKGSSAASLMVTGDPAGWVEFSDKQAGLDYTSPELGQLPDFANPLTGVYTFSTDPLVMAYNKSLLDESERPSGLGALADLVESDPSRFKHKITTYDASVSFGLSAESAWVYATPDSWALLERLLPFTRTEDSAGTMVDKINSGEYLAGFFVSSTVVVPQVPNSGNLLGWNYIDDGTPMFFRGMAIPESAPQMNAGKLMLDYLLSHEGQINVYKGGFTPYRLDLSKQEAPRTYQLIEAEVGKENLVPVTFQPMSEAQQDEFTSKWSSMLGH